ncbi:MAG: FAD binding domain-containing protein [Desulfobacterales bacterium]|jgi:CO/xanthine dehydrogenase FAD-binding subunit
MFDIDYIRPQELDEALDFLSEHGSDTTILAGGTDVMIDIRSGSLQTKYLLDISRLSAIRGIEMQDNQLAVGAAATIDEISTSRTIGRFAPALQKAANRFASRQVRNIATIGGNVAHCSPCGDTIPPLIIHEAEAVVANPLGRRTVSIESIAGGPYHCTLRTDEIITHFILKPKPDDARFSDFQKIGRRKELAIARMSMAAMVGQADDHTISFVRFALGSCTPTPCRFPEVEEMLQGRKPDGQLLWKVGRILAGRMIDITGRRLSAVYKEPAIQGLFVRLMYPLIH